MRIDWRPRNQKIRLVCTNQRRVPLFFSWQCLGKIWRYSAAWASWEKLSSLFCVRTLHEAWSFPVSSHRRPPWWLCVICSICAQLRCSGRTAHPHKWRQMRTPAVAASALSLFRPLERRKGCWKTHLTPNYPLPMKYYNIPVEAKLWVYVLKWWFGWEMAKVRGMVMDSK